jgi:hypothetical protein
MFRTQVVRDLGGYRELVPCEDFDLWLRLGEVGRLANLPAPKQPLSDRADLFRQWGWMALKEGHVKTSRRYAFKAIKAQPFRRASWRLMACSLRGR